MASAKTVARGPSSSHSSANPFLTVSLSGLKAEHSEAQQPRPFTGCFKRRSHRMLPRLDAKQWCLPALNRSRLSKVSANGNPIRLSKVPTDNGKEDCRSEPRGPFLHHLAGPAAHFLGPRVGDPLPTLPRKDIQGKRPCETCIQQHIRSKADDISILKQEAGDYFMRVLDTCEEQSEVEQLYLSAMELGPESRDGCGAPQAKRE